MESPIFVEKKRYCSEIYFLRRNYLLKLGSDIMSLHVKIRDICYACADYDYYQTIQFWKAQYYYTVLLENSGSSMGSAKS